MSLTILLRAADGIVMAADSRVTEGYTLQGPKTKDDSVKFIQLNRDTGVMTHGLYDIGIKGINALRDESEANNGQKLSWAELTGSAENIFKDVNNEWSSKNTEVQRRNKDTGFILGGLDRQEESFKVYSFESPEFAPKSITSSYFIAGQWHIARFLISKFHNKKTNIDTLKKIAAVLLLSTADVDKTVGGPVRLASITESRGFQWVNDDEMEKILDFNETFRKYFQGILQASLNAV